MNRLIAAIQVLLTGEVPFYERRVSELRKVINRLGTKIADSEAREAAGKKELADDFKARLTRRDEELATFSAESARLKKALARHLEEVTDLEAENVRFSAENANLRGALADYLEEFPVLKVGNAKFSAENAKLEEALARHLEEVTDLKTENARLSAENAKLKEGVGPLEEITDSETENANLRWMLAQQGKGALVAENDRLRRELACRGGGDCPSQEDQFRPMSSSPPSEGVFIVLLKS